MKNVVVLSVAEVLEKVETMVSYEEHGETHYRPYAVYLEKEARLRRPLMQRYGLSTDVQSAEVVILTSPICDCCDRQRTLESAIEKLQEQGFAGKLVAWRPGYQEKSLEQIVAETEAA